MCVRGDAERSVARRRQERRRVCARVQRAVSAQRGEKGASQNTTIVCMEGYTTHV